jgi:hypothetical protein
MGFGVWRFDRTVPRKLFDVLRAVSFSRTAPPLRAESFAPYSERSYSELL